MGNEQGGKTRGGQEEGDKIPFLEEYSPLVSVVFIAKWGCVLATKGRHPQGVGSDGKDPHTARLSRWRLGAA